MITDLISFTAPGAATRLEVLLHTLVVLDLAWDRNGHSLTACKSNRPGPRRREECTTRSVFLKHNFILGGVKPHITTNHPYLVGLVEGGGVFTLLAGPLSPSREDLKNRSIISSAELKIDYSPSVTIMTIYLAIPNGNFTSR